MDVLIYVRGSAWGSKESRCSPLYLLCDSALINSTSKISSIMGVSTDNLSHLVVSQALEHHPAVVLPCALLILVSISPVL